MKVIKHMKSPQRPLVVVTGNKGKADEIASITGMPVEIVKLDIPEIQSLDVEEVAREKALTAYRILAKPVVVDDTGMSIEALGGLPGALVSWFLDTLGPEGLLKLVAGETHRHALVSTCIAYADEDGVQTFLGTVEGTLSQSLRGDAGFGYDPIFIPAGQDRTYAEMNSEEKNAISMRRQALLGLKDYLSKQR